MNLQKKATIIATFTAFLLALVKLFFWIFTNSIAILSSAIDSLLDMFVSAFNFFAVSSSEKDPDEKFNFWKWKIEALASFIEWIVISISWIYIFYESVRKIFFKEEIQDLDTWLIIMFISIIITSILVFFLNNVYKKTNNLVIKSDALHYKTDLFTNIWIIIWLVVIHFTGFYYIDSILWIIISFYIIYSAFEIVKKWYLLLLDVSLDEEEIKKIEKIIKNFEKIQDFHELKTRQSWNLKIVNAHLVFQKNISLIEAHNISHKIEDKIKLLDTKNNWSILFHLDPYDDEEEDLKK